MEHAARVIECAEAVADGRPVARAGVGGDASEVELLAALGAVAAVRDLFGTANAQTRAPHHGRAVLPAGAVWGPLRILEHVGRGSFGDVYRAADPTLDRDVALKLLTERDADFAMASQAVEEGRLLARVRHPNVVAIHGAQRIDGVTGLWMEFVDGRTLAAELAERGPFTAAELIDVGLALSDALAAVHDAGLLHRDVKAPNVLRDDRGRIVLGDFGAGWALDASDVVPPKLEGTPAYLAPEIFDGVPASRESDIYSLGILLFHLATGSYPVTGRSLRALQDAHATGERRSLRSFRPDLPADLTAIIERALAPDRSDRFRSSGEIAQALADARAAPQRRTRRLLGAAIVAATVSASAAAAVWMSWQVEPVIPFEARDWVLVTAFENRTGEAELDGQAERALEFELAGSGFVNVVPRIRIDDALELLRQPRGTRVDAELGRQVSIRDEGIRAIVTGSLEKRDGVYGLAAQLVRPSDGAVVVYENATAADAQVLGDAIARLSAAIRARLGDLEAIPPPAGEDARVPTSSVRAWQLYVAARFVPGYDAQSERLLVDLPSFNPATAEQLLREALRLDPDFVAARIQLAHALARRRLATMEARQAAGDDPRVSQQPIMDELDRAVASAEGSTEIDRYMAAAAFHGWHGARTRALSTEQLRAHRGQHAAACHALLQLRPDDVWALSCVINVMLRFDGTVDLSLARRFIELRPNAVESYFTAVRAALASDDSAVASEFAQRGGALDVPLTEENANRVAMLRMFSGATAWLANRPQETLAIVDSVLASVADQARAIQLPFLWYGAYANLMLGRLDEADRLFSLLDAQDARRGRIWVDLERRDPQRLWRTLESGRIDARGRPPVSSPSEWLDAGDLARAQQALTSVSPAGTQHPRVRGELALVEGRPAEAIALLEEVLPRERLSASRLRIARFLARAWVARGDPDRAIQVLEEASNEPRSPLLTAAMMGFLWISVRDQLADLYHSAGRTTDAERVDRELAALLALADDDHPIKRRVQHRH